MIRTTATKAGAIAAITFSGFATHAQDFPGLRTGNYNGVNGVFYNPASMADSRYRYDVNVLSIHAQAGNQEANFKLSNISQSFDGDSSVSAQLFGRNTGKANGLVNFALHAPSVMFNAGNKLSFAITSRSRVLMNFRDVDGKLVKKVIDNDVSDASLPYTIQSESNMRLNATGWTEFGLSAAREVFDKGTHFLKAGVTLKYLAGTGNAYIHINNFKGSMNADLIQQDVYLNNTTGHIGMGFSGVKTDDFKASDLTDFNSTGFGGDIGLVYEFRPDYEMLHDHQEQWNETINKYKLRVGVAILDIGRLRFKPDASRSGSYDLSITGAERYHLSELEDIKIDNYNDHFKSHPQYFTPSGEGNNGNKYSVSLPTTLQLDADYHVERGFYVNLGTQLAMSSNTSKPYNSAYYNSVTLTPRMEGSRLGVYVPFNYSQLTKFNAGLGLRLGPVFLGSGSIFNLLFGSSRQADAQFGIHIYGLKKVKKEKQPPAEKEAPVIPVI